MISIVSLMRWLAVTLLLLVDSNALGTRPTMAKRQAKTQDTSYRKSIRNITKRTATSFRNVEEMLNHHHEVPLLIAFHAVNCGPCRLQRRELQTLTSMMGDDLRLVSIDTNRWPQVGSRFEVGKLPCLVMMKGGNVMARLEGLTMADDLAKTVKQVLYPASSEDE